MAKKICKEKECEACGAWFTPSRSNVKYCPNCRTHSDQIVRQMERNTQRNIDRYGYGQKNKKIQNVCKECGNEFVFTAGEQEFYAEKGFTNEPQRCKACRQARKNAAKTEREFFETVCAECGGTAKIPFKPVEGKSYYCSECFAKRKAAE